MATDRRASQSPDDPVRGPRPVEAGDYLPGHICGATVRLELDDGLGSVTLQCTRPFGHTYLHTGSLQGKDSGQDRHIGFAWMSEGP